MLRRPSLRAGAWDGPVALGLPRYPNQKTHRDPKENHIGRSPLASDIKSKGEHGLMSLAVQLLALCMVYKRYDRVQGPMAQNAPKALCSMVLGPNYLKT